VTTRSRRLTAQPICTAAAGNDQLTAGSGAATLAGRRRRGTCSSVGRRPTSLDGGKRRRQTSTRGGGETTPPTGGRGKRLQSTGGDGKRLARRRRLAMITSWRQRQRQRHRQRAGRRQRPSSKANAGQRQTSSGGADNDILLGDKHHDRPRTRPRKPLQIVTLSAGRRQTTSSTAATATDTAYARRGQRYLLPAANGDDYAQG